MPFLGQDFFPAVDSGQFRLHLRARTGTRIEETARFCDLVEQSIRQQIPPDQIDSIIDNIGLPYSSINLSYSTSAPIGPADADILVTLAKGHGPTAKYVHDLRMNLAREFPSVTFSFLPADIVSQILNFGLPSPIDIQVVGYNVTENRQFATNLLQELKHVPGTVDLRIQQPADQPYLHINVDRTKAAQVGFTQRDVATILLISLSGSFQTSPTYWLNPKNGVSYSIATQTPQYRVDSLQDLENIPVTGGTANRFAILRDVANISRGAGTAVVSHYDIQPVIDIYGSVQGRDLGGVASDINKIVKQAQKKLPRGTQVIVRGQINTMRSSYIGLIGGPGIFDCAGLPADRGELPVVARSVHHHCGVARRAGWDRVVSLYYPHYAQRSSVDGSIMCMGVATANSILVVSFAKEHCSRARMRLKLPWQPASRVSVRC